MLILDRYLLRQLLVPFSLGLVILLSGLMLERLLRLVDMVTGQGAPLGRVALLLLYLVPHYLGLALPAAFFLAALVSYRRLIDASEFSILQAAGVSARRLLVPTLLLAILFSIGMLINSGWVDPQARYAYRRTVYSLSASGQMLDFYPQVFVPLTDTLTMRAESIAPNGNLQDVFLVSRDPVTNKTVYATSKLAVVDRNEDTGVVTLILANGSSVIDKAGELARLNFAAYPWTLPTPAIDSYGPRGKDARELTLTELGDRAQKATTPAARAAFMTEQQARWVQAASLPFLLILSLSLALVGTGRRGKAYGLIAGIALLILYDKLLGFGEAAAAKGRASILLALWGPWIALAVGSLVALWLKAPVVSRSNPSAASAVKSMPLKNLL